MSNKPPSSGFLSLLGRIFPSYEDQKPKRSPQEQAELDSKLLISTSLLRGHNIDQVKEYIKNGANVNIQDNEGYTPLHRAIKSNNRDLVTTLIEAGADVNIANNEGSTPLLNAIERKHQDLVTTLIEVGADVNIANVRGSTALHLATILNNQNIITSLIEAGANVKAQNKQGESPLHYAVESMLATPAESKVIIDKLFAAGADINARNIYGQTPLFKAIMCNKNDAANVLVKSGADVNIADNHGETPLHTLAFRGNADLVKILIAKGANINTRDNNGTTPLLSAFTGFNREAASVLINAGADVNIANKDGDTPLHKAVFKRGQDLIQSLTLLIKAGVDINKLDNNGYAPSFILLRRLSEGNKDERDVKREGMRILTAAFYSDNIIKWYKGEIKSPSLTSESFPTDHYELLTTRIKSILHRDGVPPKLFEMSTHSASSAINQVIDGTPIIPPDVKSVLQNLVKEIKLNCDKASDYIENTLVTILPSLIEGKQCSSAPTGLYKDSGISPHKYLENNLAEITALDGRTDSESINTRATLKAVSIMLLHDAKMWDDIISQQKAYQHFTGASDEEAKSHNLTLEGLFNAVINGKDLPKIPHEGANLSTLNAVKDLAKVFSEDELMALDSTLKKAKEGYYENGATHSNIQNLLQIVEHVITPSMKDEYAASHAKSASLTITGAADHHTEASSPAHGGAGAGSYYDGDIFMAGSASAHHKAEDVDVAMIGMSGEDVGRSVGAKYARRTEAHVAGEAQIASHADSLTHRTSGSPVKIRQTLSELSIRGSASTALHPSSSPTSEVTTPPNKKARQEKLR